jgi:hypothetical protein
MQRNAFEKIFILKVIMALTQPTDDGFAEQSKGHAFFVTCNNNYLME